MDDTEFNEEEYKEFITFMDSNPDPVYFSGRVKMQLSRMDISLTDAAIVWGMKPEIAEREIEEPVSEMSENFKEMIKYLFKHKSLPNNTLYPITMDNVKKKYRSKKIAHEYSDRTSKKM